MRYTDPKDIDRMAEIPLAAAKAGVNYFDTAPGYSEDKSETILGVAMREMKRQGLEHYVATKTWAHDKDAFWKHLEASLKTLGVGRIDFYHAWGINDKNSFETRKREGVLRAFQEAKEQGLISHAVCSSHMSGPDIAEMVKEGLFEGILLGFNAVNFVFRTDGIRASAEQGMGVVIMNPLNGGMITDHPDRFGFLKTRPNETMLEAGLHFVFGWDGVTTALVGFRSLEDVKTSVAAVDTFRPISESEKERIRKHIGENFNDLCTTCDYCRDCPQGIPVVRYMEAFNHHMLYGGADAVFNRLKWHWGINDIAKLEECIECRVCEEKCNQKIPILERFGHIKKLMAENEKP
jgi:predicted aldo/keto reductase-like oxidoreductase